MKAHSPFTIFTCALIGEIYYKEDYRILIMGNPVDEDFENRVKDSDFFQEICLFDQREKTIRRIENTVDSFLSNHKDIDEYFMCVFSDGYSIMLAHRLLGKAKINIFPEGCAALRLKERIGLVFNEVYGKDRMLKEFFQKYKIEFDLFSKTWVFDLEIEQGDLGVEKKIIDVRRILKNKKKNKIVDRLNILYGYRPGRDYSIFFLDDTLAASDLLDGEAEIKIFDVLFSGLKKKKILVKGHPGQDFLMEKLRFEKYGVDFYENSNMPWEIMLLNILKDNREGITIITSLLATSVMSTINLLSGTTPVTIISLQQLEMNYFADYIQKAIQLNGNYYEDAILKNKNIHLFTPGNLEELEKYFKIKSDETNKMTKKNKSDQPSDYFFRTGNMISKATAFSMDGQFYVKSAFYFLKYQSEIVFCVEKDIDIKEFIWSPSECNLFSAVNGVAVEIENDYGIKQMYMLGDSRKNDFLDDGKFVCKVRYKGYCKNIYIKAHLMVEHKYCALNWLYNDCKWREEFWKNWFKIEKRNLLKKYIDKKNIKSVWIFGNGEIGQAINDSFEFNNVKTKFTASKTSCFKGIKAVAIEEAYKTEILPDIMIITPMNDFDLIYFKLEADLKSVAIGLNKFIPEVIQA